MSFSDMTNEQIVSRYGGTTWQRIQDRYLVAAGSNHTVDTTGGSSTVTLTTANLPSHSHDYYRSNTSTGSHTLTTNEIPSHTHNLKYEVNARATGGSPNIGTGTAVGSETTASTRGGGSHTHSITRTSVATSDTGSGTAVNIEPPYIAIYMWRRIA